eukprot:182290_1
MSRGKSVHKRIKLSSEINSIDFWYKHYYNEYEDSHVNPNQSFINSNQDLTDLYTQSTIDCIISEQCLLALTDNKPVVDASCEWLKYHDCYVYNRIRYKSQLNHGDAQSVLEIVAKIRMIFKHNLTNIAVSNDKLFKIPNLYIELKYNFQRQQDHWTRVRLFRSQQKEYIELYRCPDCQKQMIFKTISCIEWPQFLILTLNRWGSSDTDKLEYLIDSPQLLTIDRSTNVRYQLYCVVNHTVDPNHYTVNVLNDRSWFRINDDVISICMEQQIITKNAYILCYQKIDNDEL